MLDDILLFLFSSGNNKNSGERRYIKPAENRSRINVVVINIINIVVYILLILFLCGTIRTFYQLISMTMNLF